MPRRRSLPVFTAIVLAALWSSTRETTTQSSPAPEYGVADIGTLGGATSTALAIHPELEGQIVGYSHTDSGSPRAFAWATGVMSDLGTLGGISEAWAVSRGGIVGRSQSSTGAYRAVSYPSYTNPDLTDLGTLGGSQSYATGINSAGAIVGASLLSGNTVTRAFIYDGGVMSALGAGLGGANTVANAINDSGQVVGRADLAGGTIHHAFLFANGTTTDLGTLGTNSEAYAISESGIVVGRSQLTSGSQHAFRYVSGVMQDLGTLGGAASEAHAINQSGVVVGWAHMATGARHAFVWRDGVMRDLNALIPAGTGWVLEAASGISDAGHIVGYGTLNGQRRAFLLLPPVDLGLQFRFHGDIYQDTNIPNPHETGEDIPWGVSIIGTGPATNVVVTVTISGAVSFVPGSFRIARGTGGECQPSGQALTCRLPYFDGENHVFYRVRATAPGAISHSVSVRADQPDPVPSNNSGSDSNTAVSLASLTLNPTTVVAGRNSLGRATLTSPCPPGGARVTLTSSHPDIASVPAEFDVLPWGGDAGLWREFYVTTRAVNAPVTVQISARYGLVTRTVPLTIVPDSRQLPYGGTPRAVPGTIQAEDFDEGGEGVAYHDTTTSNSGGAYRTTGVDLEITRDAGGGVNVGWIAAGEWLEYTIDVASTGTYTLEARVASPGAGGTFHVEVDGANKTGPLSVPNTGSWQTWTTVSRSVTLDAGSHILRIAFDANASTGAVGNLNYLRLTSTGGTGPTPFGGTPRALPGTIQAEHFDDGGEAVAYHDTSTGNSGGQYRSTGVDIEPTRDIGGGYNVGWMAATEWLNYTVNVGTAGTYTLTARVAANGPGGTFHVEFGGAHATGPLTIPNTGGWQNWTNVTATVTLAAGVQWMRVVVDRAGSTGVVGNLNYIRLDRVGDSAPADIVLYASDFTRHGRWALQSEPTAAAGQTLLTPDTGWSTTSSPLASPADYLEATFSAPAGTSYALWLRIRATGDTKYSESVWVQYSDARANGASAYPIGTTSGLLVNLEDCSACGVSGWGWQNGAYWLSQPAAVTFAGSGPHVIRIQVREDGAQIDQVVLSPSRYLTTAPGPVKNDSTIVPK